MFFQLLVVLLALRVCFNMNSSIIIPKTVSFYSRWFAESLIEPSYIISIGEDKYFAKFKIQHHSVLQLGFHDIDSYLGEKYTIFSKEHAIKIIEWIEKHKNVCSFIVHCEAGISRSAAIAKFLVDFYDFKLKKDKYCDGDFSLMNFHVYKTLSNVYKENFLI